MSILKLYVGFLLLALISCTSREFKHQPVEISIEFDSISNSTILNIDPNGVIRIPSHSKQVGYSESRNTIHLTDSVGTSLSISKHPPEYSICYDEGMTAEEWVEASFQFEKEALGDRVESYEKLVDDTILNFSISQPDSEKQFHLRGAKNGFVYLFGISSHDLADDKQILFIKNLFLNN